MRLHILLTVIQSKQLGSRDDKTMQLQLYLRESRKKFNIRYSQMHKKQKAKKKKILLTAVNFNLQPTGCYQDTVEVSKGVILGNFKSLSR